MTTPLFQQHLDATGHTAASLVREIKTLTGRCVCPSYLYRIASGKQRYPAWIEAYMTARLVGFPPKKIKEEEEKSDD